MLYGRWRGLVAGDHPVVGSCHGELECCFEVWLFEDSEHAPRVWNFELCVEIDLVVDRINKAVQAFTGVGVFRISNNGQRVVCLQVI